MRRYESAHDEVTMFVQRRVAELENNIAKSEATLDKLRAEQNQQRLKLAEYYEQLVAAGVEV